MVTEMVRSDDLAGVGEMAQKTVLPTFDYCGFTRPAKGLSVVECEELVEEWAKVRTRLVKVNNRRALDKVNSGVRVWLKSTHLVLHRIAAYASRSDILGQVRSVLGDDLILWGSSIVERKPGHIHKWHVDREHFWWKGVSVFVGLTGMSRESSLKVVYGSHKFPKGPEGVNRIDHDADVSKLAARYIDNPEIVIVGLNVGEYFLFDGRLWHGSNNRGDVTRYALLMQYTTPDSVVRVPVSDREGMHGSSKVGGVQEWFYPPCVLVSGRDVHHVSNVLAMDDLAAFNA